MAPLSTHREAILYVADSGVSYQVTGMAAEATQPILGGVVAAGTEPVLPEGVKPRRVEFRTFDLTPNVGREVTVYTLTAYNAIARGQVVNLNHSNDSHAFRATGRKTAEKIKTRNVTLQIT